jgi:hypothetical protein
MTVRSFSLFALLCGEGSVRLFACFLLRVQVCLYIGQNRTFSIFGIRARIARHRSVLICPWSRSGLSTLIESVSWRRPLLRYMHELPSWRCAVRPVVSYEADVWLLMDAQSLRKTQVVRESCEVSSDHVGAVPQGASMHTML